MKILKIILGLVVGLALVFFAVGIFAPSFTYENKVEVNASVEKAWAIFTDQSRMGDWLTGFQSMETISGNPGEVGSKYRMIFVENGEEMVIMEEVTAFQENKLFGFTLDADPLISDVEVKFTGDESKTEITATNHVEGKNLLWKSMLRIMKSMIANRGQEQYDKLKEIIESAPSEPMSELVN